MRQCFLKNWQSFRRNLWKREAYTGGGGEKEIAGEGENITNGEERKDGSGAEKTH